MKAAERQVGRWPSVRAADRSRRARVQDLSVGEQQRVEILSSLYRGAEVLILDEPTAVLTPQEADSLVVSLKKMAAQGKTIVFISHKLDEVLKLTDRVTVLRAGRVVFEASDARNRQGTAGPRDDRPRSGRPASGAERPDAGPGRARKTAVPAAEPGPRSQPPAAQQARPGACSRQRRSTPWTTAACLPCAGVSLQCAAAKSWALPGWMATASANWRRRSSALRRLQAGQLFIGGEDASHWTRHDFLQRSTGYIPDDRQNDGLILDFDLSRNATLKLFERPPFSSRGFLRLPRHRRSSRGHLMQAILTCVRPARSSAPAPCPAATSRS